MTWKGFYITININKTRNNITGYNVSFVCNVTEAVPFCELLIHRNVIFLKSLQKFQSALGYWLPG